ncbi:MAG: RecQ family ATP-dependent DNA helicase, partial [Bacteroidales bacterium]|nr:RecQ family ATP-dependent DNA helicase [Bacteroidales bacterium]
SESLLFEQQEVEKAVRIIKSLITEKHIAKAQDAEAESRVDYLADILGMKKSEVISVVERMRQEGILADTKDLTAYMLEGETERKSRSLLERFAKLEEFILKQTSGEMLKISCRQFNDNAVKGGIDTSTEKDIRTLLYFLSIKGYLRKKEDASHNLEILRQHDYDSMMTRYEKRIEVSRCIVEKMYNYALRMTEEEKAQKTIQFSVVTLLKDVKAMLAESFFGNADSVQLEDVEEALLYLSKIGALKLEGGFLVIYNAMQISRLKERNLKYKKDDYQMLDAFYKQKIQQIHIVGEYANLMVRDYQAALQYVQDYFQMDYKRFIAHYFKGERVAEIQRNLTPQKYNQIYSKLSKRQMEIISDKESRSIVVAAGPGSGKTMVLVHKLASLLQL